MKDILTELEDRRLYLVGGPTTAPRGEFLDRLSAALDAGVALFQLREKSGSFAERLEIGREVKRLCARAACPFIVNDDPELALELGAFGVHVGQDDMGVAALRARIGSTMAIGLSTHDAAQLGAADADDQVQMMGFGPIFATRTKDAGPSLGPRSFADSGADRARKPVFAIGGVSAENLPELLAAGCRRIAVSAAILHADDVAAATRRLDAMLRA